MKEVVSNQDSRDLSNIFESGAKKDKSTKDNLIELIEMSKPAQLSSKLIAAIN
jgi:hypothetical protein